MTPWHALVYTYAMISKPNQTQLRALAALNRAPGWTDITAFLDGELQAVYLHLASSRDDAILKQMQGRAQFITEFQKLVRDAEPALEKLRDNSLL